MKCQSFVPDSRLSLQEINGVPQMNDSKKTITFYLFFWLAASAIYFYFSESITKMLFPGYDHVEKWILVLISGWAILFTVFLLLIAFTVIRKLKKRK